MPTIRTTLEPWREITVSDAEYLRLLEQGLVYTGETPPPPPPAFNDAQYAELARPGSEAAKRLIEAISKEAIVDDASAEVLAQLEPVIAQLEGLVEGATDRSDELEQYVNQQVAAIKPAEGIIQDGATRILPVGQGELVLRPEYFGALGNGLFDDTAAIQRMLTYASTPRPIPRRFRCYFGGIYRITDTLFWDVYTTCVSGPGLILSAINNAAKYMVRTFSTDPAEEGSPVRQRAVFWEGVILYGDNVTGGVDVAGASGSDKPAHVTFRNTTICRQGVAMHYGRNAYMVSHFACNISLSRVGVWHEESTNSGERIEFFGCDITGHGVAVKLSSGQAMHFVSCSFSYVLRRIAEVATGQMFMEACHFEFNAPYAPFFLISGSGGYIAANNSRWLIRDPSPSISSGITFPDGGSTATWADNPRDRWGEGDPVTLVGLAGSTSLSNSTIYYMRNVTRSGFQLSATPTGAIITWTGAGTATGLLADASAPIFRLDNSLASATIRDGHVHGSATGLKTWCDGVGAQRFEITGTATFGSTPLRMRTRPGGDLRDPSVVTAGAILDDWEVTGPVTIGTSADKLAGTNSIIFTRTGAGAARGDLWIPIPAMARILWYHNYKSSAEITVNEKGYLLTSRRVGTTGIPGLGGTLWDSNLSMDTTWKQYAQAGQNDRRSPRWAAYLLVRFDFTNLAVGGTVQIDYPEISFT